MTAVFSEPTAEAAVAAATIGAVSDVAAVGVADAVASTASEMTLVWSCGEPGAGTAEAPAATLAAAMADTSGAVVFAFGGGTAGISVKAVATGIATAIAEGVATEDASCSAEAGASAGEAASADGLSVCCALLPLREPDFVRICGPATVSASAWPGAVGSEIWPAPGSRSSAVLVALWSAAVS